MTKATDKLQEIIDHLVDAKTILRNINGNDMIGHRHLVETTKKIVHAGDAVVNALSGLEWLMERELELREDYVNLLGSIKDALGTTIDVDTMTGDPMDEEEDGNG